LFNVDLHFPIIADPSREIAHLYDMLDEQDLTNLDEKGIPFTVRSVYVIDPKKTIRLTLTYPASTGRHFGEVLRIIDSLQLGDKNKITTPANWQPGGKAIMHPSVKTEVSLAVFWADWSGALLGGVLWGTLVAVATPGLRRVGR
jgi:alkyl hydroperoxide reductase subunit AhpC